MVKIALYEIYAQLHEDPMKGKAPEYAHYIVVHCNIGVTKDLFHTSFASWKDAWLLDTCAIYHMTFLMIVN